MAGLVLHRHLRDVCEVLESRHGCPLLPVACIFLFAERVRGRENENVTRSADWNRRVALGTWQVVSCMGSFLLLTYTLIKNHV